VRSHSSRTQLHVGIESHTQALSSQSTVSGAGVHCVCGIITEGGGDNGELPQRE